MNRTELVEQLARRGGLPARDVLALVEMLFGSSRGEEGVIAEALDRGEKVTISGFGTFAVRTRAAREVRDPRSGRPVAVPAGRVPVFRPGVALRDSVR
ncbi:MAG: HU family DNA-binding protein [Acidobacteria bacterium]|nr:HU family DNA-binding protein [Acidobacteriota bacterium]